MEPDLQTLVAWLVAFDADRHKARYFVSEIIYAELRMNDYLCVENKVTDKGARFMREVSLS